MNKKINISIGIILSILLLSGIAKSANANFFDFNWVGNLFNKKTQQNLGRTICMPFQGCTGTSTPPTYGKLLVGTSAGVYQLQATSTLGIADKTLYVPYTGATADVDLGIYGLKTNQIGSTGSAYFATSGGSVGIATSTPNTLLQLFSTATSTLSIDSNSASKGGCIEIKDKSGTGYTYLYAEDGVLYSDTISCK